MKTLSIVIPAYNEEATLATLLDKVLEAKVSLKKEIIIINDGSKDKTLSIARKYARGKKNIQVIDKENGGKGSAIRAGIIKAKGDIVIVQDADLEYDPNDYQACINPIISGKYKVVYGSRRLNKSNKKYSGIIFFIGGNLVTLATNILFFSRLTDEPTCYKTFHKDIFGKYKITFRGNRFDWEPEITAKILKKGLKIKEVPISYYPRSAEEGKKINYKDFFEAIWTLVKYRFTN